MQQRLLVVCLLVCFIAAAAFAQSPCSFPTTPVDPNNQMQVAQTAWQIFVAAACSTSTPTQYPMLQWETWLEQAQVYPGMSAAASYAAAKKRAAAHRFHGSPLGIALARKNAMATGALPPTMNQSDCNTSPTTQPGMKPSPSPICEEVRMSPSTTSYVGSPLPGATLAFRPPQAQFATAPMMPPQPFGPFGPLGPSSGWVSSNINFPTSSVEIKVDWIQYTPTCPASVQGSVWTETYGGNCYALAAMHLISKLTPNWIWATFEPQNPTTNANRCVVLGCNDPYGSSPAQTPPNSFGATTQISPALQSLMTAANVNAVWQNYRLDGVQTTFVDGSGNPVLLGNSVIEGENANVPLQHASCQSCHAYSSINAAGTDGIFNLPNLNPPANNWGPIGNVPPPPQGFALRDFVWSLSMACPGSPFGGNTGPGVANCAAAPPPSNAVTKSKKKK